jgi:hypothetical protein
LNSLSGSGIGSGFAHYGNSTVINLSIHDGNITGLNSLSGSGISSGSGHYGNSAVINLSSHGGNITGLNLLSGSGIGSGRGRGHSGNSNIPATDSKNSAIGDGYLKECIASRVEALPFSNMSC